MEGDADTKRSVRPTTARRRPPKVKEGAVEVQAKDIAPAPKKTSGIMIDGQADDVRLSGHSNCDHLLNSSDISRRMMKKSSPQKTRGWQMNLNQIVEQTRTKPRVSS